jgi:hypothetical protein
MATATLSNPIPDLMYDWLTVLQSKAEGLNAYETHIGDAEREGATECADMFHKLHEQDSKQVDEIKKHLKMVLSHFKV